MRLTAAMLADHASVKNGGLYVLGGGVDKLSRSKFPSPFGVEIALEVEFEQSEAGTKHALSLQIKTERGRPVMGLDGEFTVNPTEESPYSTRHVPIAVALPAEAALPRPGTYMLSVLIDGEEQRTIWFRAVRAERPQPRKRTRVRPSKA
jgi:hypothetical protein